MKSLQKRIQHTWRILLMASFSNGSSVLDSISFSTRGTFIGNNDGDDDDDDDDDDADDDADDNNDDDDDYDVNGNDDNESEDRMLNSTISLRNLSIYDQHPSQF